MRLTTPAGRRSGLLLLLLALASTACFPPARDPDLNDDGVVDDADLRVWFECVGDPMAHESCPRADFDGDGVVGPRDGFYLGPALGRRVCNGDVSLCDRSFREVAFPTAHNAFAGPYEKFSVYYNQDVDMTALLEHGVRGLMLDTHYFDKNDDGLIAADETFLCHVQCTRRGKIRLRDGLAEIGSFLDAHPAEVVTLIFESYVSAADTELAFEESGLIDLVYVHDPASGWPTLAELIDAGERVVVLTDDAAVAGGPPWDPPWYTYVWDVAFETNFSVEFREDFRCQDLRGEPGADLFILNHFLTQNAAVPAEADEVNALAFFAERARRCWQCQDQIPNFPTVDFATTGDVVGTAERLNDLWGEGSGARPPFAADAEPLEGFCMREPFFVSPEDETQIALDAEGAFDVELDLGTPLPEEATFEAVLRTGAHEPPGVESDVSDRFAVEGSRARASFGAGDLAPGLVVLAVAVDYDGDGSADGEIERTFSYEPEIDPELLERCDLLDPRLCLYPFPNDHFTRPDPSTDTGLRLDVARESMPKNSNDFPVDPSAVNEADGFSVGPMILTHVFNVDLEQSGAAPITDMRQAVREPDAAVVLLDALTGERVPLWTEEEARVHARMRQDRSIIIRPGRNLEDGHRYVVALRHMLDREGEPVPPSRLFTIYRDAIPTYIPAVEARRPEMEALFALLEANGIAREDLYLAWDFTTQSTRSISERLLHMRDDAFAALGGAAPAFQVTNVEERTPEQDPRRFRRIDGTFEVPNYLTGDGGPGSLLTRQEGSLLPFRNGTFQAEFRCTVPHTVEAEGGGVVPARLSLYGHGLLGDQGEVGAGHVEEMAHEHDFVFCATKWVGMSEDDVDVVLDQIIPDFSNFPKLTERLHQAMLNFLFLGRLMIHPDGFASDPAFQLDVGGGEMVSFLDTSDLFYDGNSQGGIAAGALAAIAQDIHRFVLGVPGMNYSTLLRRSVDFDPFLTFLLIQYDDPPELALLISMAEILWERVETNGHANHLTSDPYPGTPPKKILFHVAFGDFQVADVTAEIAARTVGASIRQPALKPEKIEDAEPFWGIPDVPAYPFDGSALVIWDAGNPPAPQRDVPPQPEAEEFDVLSECAQAFNLDPHECPRRQAAARLQKSEFLRTDGAVVDTCPPGEPCTAYDVLP